MSLEFVSEFITVHVREFPVAVGVTGGPEDTSDQTASNTRALAVGVIDAEVYEVAFVALCPVVSEEATIRASAV